MTLVRPESTHKLQISHALLVFKASTYFGFGNEKN
jgi:hypothetical protein